MSLLEAMWAVEVPGGLGGILTYEALKDIFLKELQCPTPKAVARARTARHARRRKRLKRAARVSNDLGAGEGQARALATATAALEDEMVDVDVDVSPQLHQREEAAPRAEGPAGRQGARKRRRRKNPSAGKERKKKTANEGARGGAQRGRRAATTAPTPPTKKKRAKGRRRLAEAASSTEGDSTESPVRHPMTRAGEVDDRGGTSATFRREADAIMAKMLEMYDEDRNVAVFFYFAVVLQLLMGQVVGTLKESVRVAERQQQALTARLLESSARVADESDCNNSNNSNSTTSGSSAAGEDAPGADTAGAATPEGRAGKEEDGSDEDAESSDRDDVDISDFNDSIMSLQFSAAHLAQQALAGHLSMATAVPFLDSVLAAARSFSARPCNLLQEYLAQRESQFVRFEEAWRTQCTSVAGLVRSARACAAARDSGIAPALQRQSQAPAALPTAHALHGASAVLAETPPSVVAAVAQELRAAPLPWTNTRLANLLSAYEALEAAGTQKTPRAASTHKSPQQPGKKPLSTLIRGEGAEVPPTASDASKKAQPSQVGSEPLVHLFLPELGASLFEEGPFNLLTPPATPECVRAMLHWLLADTTEVDMRKATRTASEEGVPQPTAGSAAPSCPSKQQGHLWDPAAGVLTFLHPSRGVVCLRLRNPLPFLNFSAAQTSQYSCDCCNLAKITVGYEAFILERTTDSRSFSTGMDAFGFNVCLPCALHVYHSATLRLARALHPDRTLRRGFEHGVGSRMHVRGVHAGVAAGRGGTAAAAAALVVCAEVGVAPYAARPVAWVVPPAALADMAAAFPTLASAVPLTDRQRRALPVPPTPFTPFQAPTATVASISTLFSGAEERPEECPVCLQPLNGEGPAMRTKCGHWFHLACISAFYDGSSNGTGTADAENQRGCPLCRCRDFMPVLDEADVLARNVYRLTLHLPDGAGGPYQHPDTGEIAVALATLLSSDGRYHNPTNVAACQLFMLKPLTAPVSRAPRSCKTLPAATRTANGPPLSLPSRTAFSLPPTEGEKRTV